MVCKVKNIDRVGKNYILTVKPLNIDNLYLNKNCGSRIRVYCKNSNIQIGNIIKVIGNVHLFLRPTNPGEFDYFSYYYSLGERFIVFSSNISVLSNKINFLNNIVTFKNSINKKIDYLYNKNDSGFIKCILIGDKHYINNDLKNLYRDSGIIHILAISGLHISFIGILIYSSFKKFLKNKFIVLIIVNLFLLIYLSICSYPISAIRAYLMLLIYFIGDIIGRKHDIGNSLGLIASIMLICNPYLILNVSFIFSFSSLYFLGYVCNLINNRFVKILVFQLGIIPIIANYYYVYPIYSFIINFLLIPIFSILIISCIFSICVSSISLFISNIFVLLNHSIIDIYTKVCIFFRNMPFHLLTIGKPSIFQIIVYYILYIFLIRYYINDQKSKKVCNIPNIISKFFIKRKFK